MTALELFQALDPLVAPAMMARFNRRDLCIVATRVALDVAEYFGVEARPVAVRAIVYNAAFAARVARGGDFSGDWTADGSYSVGIGFGFKNGAVVNRAPACEPATRLDPRLNKWNGHLIAAAEGAFGDFSIGQAEREQHGIITGEALVGPWNGTRRWSALNDAGTTVEYELIDNVEYLRTPDWRDRTRRTRIVGELIRRVKQEAGIMR